MNESKQNKTARKKEKKGILFLMAVATVRLLVYVCARVFFLSAFGNAWRGSVAFGVLSILFSSVQAYPGGEMSRDSLRPRIRPE